MLTPLLCIAKSIGPGPSQAEGPGGHMLPHFLADRLTLSQPGETDYAHLITTGTPGFLDLPTALILQLRDGGTSQKIC